MGCFYSDLTSARIMAGLAACTTSPALHPTPRLPTFTSTDILLYLLLNILLILKGLSLGNGHAAALTQSRFHCSAPPA
jgi:hypothetical protein